MPWRLFPPRQGDYGQRMRTESIAYEVTGQSYVGYAAYPDHANGAGVLIAGEGTGLGTPVKERAHALAELGSAAFALDYIGEGRVLTEVPAMVARLTELRADLDHVRALGRAGLAQLI